MSASPSSASYPAALREQAFERYCAGQRSPAIAKALAVPERTIRAWLATACQQLAAARSGTAQAAAALAEARQLQIAAAAWDSYRRHAEAEQHQLDDLRFATHDELASASAPRLSASGARYLALALRATDLAAKLSGAYTCPPPQPAAVELRMLHARPRPQDYPPPGGPHDPTVPVLTGPELERWQHQEWVDGLQAQIESDQELLAQGQSRLAELNALLAPTSPDPASPPPPPADPTFADDEDDDEDDADGEDNPPAATRTDIPAESATVPAVPAASAFRPTTRAPAVHCRETALPAKTATVTESGLAAGIQPANSNSALPSLTSASPAVSPLLVGAARAEGSDDAAAERASVGAQPAAPAAVGPGVGSPSDSPYLGAPTMRDGDGITSVGEGATRDEDQADGTDGAKSNRDLPGDDDVWEPGG